MGARRAWRKALDSTREEALRASLLLATAASQERTGERNSAIETYRVLWHMYPLSEEEKRAGARLDELETELDEPLRSAVDWRRRADNLYRGRRNGEAHQVDALSPNRTARARRPIHLGRIGRGANRKVAVDGDVHVELHRAYSAFKINSRVISCSLKP